MKQQGIPGMTVALAKNGTIIYAQAYGVSDMAMHSASQTSTIFEIGSITKQFTAALIMQLQEQGELHVDDSIQAYLPEYKFPSAITLRMLLTHTSGLANYTTFAQYPGLGLLSGRYGGISARWRHRRDDQRRRWRSACRGNYSQRSYCLWLS
jgi:CubicO group peptidase (beta-lactamase class C family)